MKPLISVIIPIYKAEKYLDRCVKSIVNQTYCNLEIILVDDGSPDRCPAICDEWEKVDNRIQVIHKENEGVSMARNTGLTYADGEFISFIDADDWVAPEFIETLYDALNENNAEVAECGAIWTTSEDVNSDYNEEKVILDTKRALECNIKGSMFVDMVTIKLYRREIITVPFKEGKWHEDVFWVYQILNNCTRLIHIRRKLYYYFRHEGSFIAQPFSISRVDETEAKYNRCQFIRNNYPELAELAEVQLINSCLYQAQILYRSKEMDLDGEIRKRLHRYTVEMDFKWFKGNLMEKKQKLWIFLYRFAPGVVCKTRNLLKIGL